MSSTFQYAEGAVTTGAGNTRTISSIVGNVVTIGTEFTSVPAVGRTLEIINNTGDTLNNQLYTLVNTPVAGGGTNGVRTYTLRPTPTAGGTLGSLRQRVVTNAITLAASTITSVVVLGGNQALLTVAGANFRTAEVHIGDRIVVTGSAAANNGAWYVLSVLSNTELVLVPPDGGAGMAASVVGTVSARVGSLTVAYTNQATLSLTDLHDNCIPAAGPGGSSRGPGTIPDWLKMSFAAGGFDVGTFYQRILFEFCGISQIIINQSGLGAPSFWNATNEIWINKAKKAPAGVLSCRISVTGSWGVGNFLTMTLGEQNGNRFSAENGVTALGIGILVVPDVSSENRLQLFGCEIDAANMTVLLGDGNAACSLVRSALTTGAGVVESMICYGDFALVVTGTGDQGNVTVASQSLPASIVDPSTAEGLLYSDLIQVPSALAFGDLTVKNPRVNFDLVDVYGGSGSTGTFIKTYSYDPLITHFNEATGILGIEGRRIHIFEINQDTGDEVEVYDGVTGGGGTLILPCPDLRVQQFTAPATNDYFAHRFEQTGGGLPDQIITTIITSPIVGDAIPAYDDVRVWTKRIP